MFMCRKNMAHMDEDTAWNREDAAPGAGDSINDAVRCIIQKGLAMAPLGFPIKMLD